MKPISMINALSVVALLALTACGGGGSSVAPMAQPMLDQPQQPAAERLPFPYTAERTLQQRGFATSRH